MLVRMEFAAFGVDPSKNSPALVLRESGGKRTLSLAVGPLEASAVAIDSLGVPVDKPMGIDLTRAVLRSLGGRVERLVLAVGQEPGSISAQLHVIGPGGLLLIDCAPSHGVVLALRCEAPVFAFERLLEAAAGSGKQSPAEALRRHIASLDTVDFGTYYVE